MRPAVELIRAKRDGAELSTAEIQTLIAGYVAGQIPDYQMAALCMAIYFQGLSAEETAALTQAMADSGERLELKKAGITDFIADKHSTGGVGDKVSLVLGPLVASAGLCLAKLSGRGLGYTGGTIDKLEAIAGFKATLSREEFIAQAQRVGLVVAESSAELVPADKKLYALRDVTATVQSLPLIVSSILSKKLVIDSDGIVFDVKVGEGALMRELPAALELAQELVVIGRQVGRRCGALISDMSQPLGYAVGNALEVREALETLRGGGPDDLRQLSLALGGELLLMAGRVQTPEEAKNLLAEKLSTGAALAKFSAMVQAQGGDAVALERPERLPQAGRIITVRAERSGYVTELNARAIGEAAHWLGAGREVKGQAIDPAVGVLLQAKIGDWVKRGGPLAELHLNDPARTAAAQSLVLKAFKLSAEPVAAPELIRQRLAGY